MQALHGGARPGDVATPRRPDGARECRHRLRLREPAPREVRGAQGQRGRLRPAAALERVAGGNRGKGVGGAEVLEVHLADRGDLVDRLRGLDERDVGPRLQIGVGTVDGALQALDLARIRGW